MLTRRKPLERRREEGGKSSRVREDIRQYPDPVVVVVAAAEHPSLRPSPPPFFPGTPFSSFRVFVVGTVAGSLLHYSFGRESTPPLPTLSLSSTEEGIRQSFFPLVPETIPRENSRDGESNAYDGEGGVKGSRCWGSAED